MSERQVNKAPEKAPKVKKSSLEGVVFTSSGSHIAPVYKRVYVKDVDANIVQKVDSTDLFEFIQASASQTDLAILERRFIETGEIPSVDSNLQFGIDTSSLPSDIHGVYAMVNDVDGNFNKLPKSIQDIFGSSQAYLKALLDGTYQATIVNALNNMQTKQEEKKEGNE